MAREIKYGLQRWFKNMRGARTFAVMALALVVFGCSTGSVNERVAYWTKITAEQVTPGTTLEKAHSILAARGLDLHCCVSGPDGRNSYFGSEKNVGRLWFTQYSVAVIVNLTPGNVVEDVRVERWGLGL